MTVENDRMTLSEVKRKYPNQWVGLGDIKYVDDDGVTIESAVVKYIDKSRDELYKMMAEGQEITPWGTFPESVLFSIAGI